MKRVGVCLLNFALYTIVVYKTYERNFACKVELYSPEFQCLFLYRQCNIDNDRVNGKHYL